MGGVGSRSYSDNLDRGGRPKKSAVAVCGTGIPEMPDGLPADVQQAWQRIAEMTSGVTFSQDSMAITEAARLAVWKDKLSQCVETNPADLVLGKMALSVGRQLLVVMAKLGLTPRDRQSLVVPRKDEPESKSRLAQLRERQSGSRN